MSEFAVILAVLGVAAVALLPVARPLEPVLSRVERGLLWLSMGLILFVMAFVCVEVAMRYLFNSPIPGHLEGSELLMPMIVFFALSYTQSVHGHVGMTLVVDAVPDRTRRRLQLTTLLLTLFVCAVMTYYSGAQAHRAWLYDDVTMTPPYFKTWPSAAAVPIGFAACTLRVYLQLLKRISSIRYGFPDKHPPGTHGEA